MPPSSRRSLPVPFSKDPAGDAKGLDARRDAAIDGDLEQRLPQLLPRAAIAQSASEVDLGTPGGG